MLLVIVVQGTQHCHNLKHIPQFRGDYYLFLQVKLTKLMRNRRWVGRGKPTDEGKDDEEYVEPEAGAGGDEESGDGGNGDDDGGHGDGEKHLDGQYGVDLADEGPPQLRRLQHHGIQRRRPRRLHVPTLPVPRPRPHSLRNPPSDDEAIELFSEGDRKRFFLSSRAGLLNNSRGRVRAREGRNVRDECG